MQNLITSAQMREADAYTIGKRPISSIKLMENAASAFVKAFKKHFTVRETSIALICGHGNNGGDGLAIARLLSAAGYKQLKVYILQFHTQQSTDFSRNLKRLTKTKIPVIKINDPVELKLEASLTIDAILGSGLNRPLSGQIGSVVSKINQSGSTVISVDIPTGLPAEGPVSPDYNGIKAALTITFQRPKLNFFFPESVQALQKFKVVDIGLDENYIQHLPGSWKLTDDADIRQLLQPRQNFSHKGTYGHALIVAGSPGTMGAALLAGSACLHAGAGLTTLCIPSGGSTAVHTALPEVMILPRTTDLEHQELRPYQAIAIGPGAGSEIEPLLSRFMGLQTPLVIDADGLAILSRRRDLLDSLPANTILTPHMKEFDRLFGSHQHWWDRLATAQGEARRRNVIILLKNQYTFVCLPSGEIYVNATGNPAMASGGMGDVLTGIIASLLAQSYKPGSAAILAAYLHGKAGDQLAKKQFVVTAGEVARQISKTMKKIVKKAEL